MSFLYINLRVSSIEIRSEWAYIKSENYCSEFKNRATLPLVKNVLELYWIILRDEHKLRYCSNKYFNDYNVTYVALPIKNKTNEK